jgi:fused signal recognition particle receptor
MFEKLKTIVTDALDKIVKTELNEETLETLLWDFKLKLIENDVALSVTDEICNQIKEQLIGVQVRKLDDKKQFVETALRETLYKVLEVPAKVDLEALLTANRNKKEPLIIVFLGVNGTGKTTTIAKMANHFLKKDYSVVLAGSDTYRAGSIEQLEAHAERLGIRVIKQFYGSDAAAVAFDAINYAKSNGINIVLVDTAGRMQTNRNLIDEMKKIVKVTKPHLVILVVDALTGNDAVEQCQIFDTAVGIDGVILTKLDADVKGGAALSIAFTTKKPIIFVGTGQLYEDLASFEAIMLINNIFD